MRIGYPCLNLSIGCSSSRTFRLKSYSQDNLINKINLNLECLEKTLRFNIDQNILFFRITSDLIPFASHPQCTFKWQDYFLERFKSIGGYIRSSSMRISMHPDQFVLLNSFKKNILDNSIRELIYHAEILDLLGLDSTSKIQIHIGGIYDNKVKSLRRFINRFKKLDRKVQNRLVIENDDKLYKVCDCLEIYQDAGIPVLFDVFHHSLNNYGESTEDCVKKVFPTWENTDGLPIVDYSSQDHSKRIGAHAKTLDTRHFKYFLEQTKSFDFDIMLEIKDKEKSAIKAIYLLSRNKRLRRIKCEKK
ncbi:MAG: UV DNA damage repair endonuclease UvsE [Candidatus Omnitrophica bacterium]|jgi:UV DNA damage endonuclease|nr:UV DNA damage repair endonuclease UvsE [Candidatus Omnitrophota bacterium]